MRKSRPSPSRGEKLCSFWQVPLSNRNSASSTWVADRESAWRLYVHSAALCQVRFSAKFQADAFLIQRSSSSLCLLCSQVFQISQHTALWGLGLEASFSGTDLGTYPDRGLPALDSGALRKLAGQTGDPKGHKEALARSSMVRERIEVPVSSGRSLSSLEEHSSPLQ